MMMFTQKAAAVRAGCHGTRTLLCRRALLERAGRNQFLDAQLVFNGDVVPLDENRSAFHADHGANHAVPRRSSALARLDDFTDEEHVDSFRTACQSASVSPLSDALPLLLTVDETASLLRTTRKAIYAMVERGQLPGVTRLGRRVLVRSDMLIRWLCQK